ATGNELTNTLTGNAGANVLDGGAEADTLIGGAGDDTYVVDNTTDVVTETAGEGTDLIESSVTYTASSNVENLTLTGTDAINATGNELTNTLTGNAGANVLDGGAEADTLIGGAGDDIYVVDADADIVVEFVDEGLDLIQASVSYLAAANVENIVLTGVADIAATGNELANMLTGNTGRNILNGGTGNDTLSGGEGDDTYVVDSTTDVVTEAAGEGVDLILSAVSYAAAANIEKLTLTGAAAINATGNALANTLTGNSGNNVLNGGSGADTMQGGLGNDTYLVDDADDVVAESAGGGTDLIQAAVSYTASANVERLILTGSASINATGNTLANTLTGNSGDNLLNGGAGADTMTGGAGHDIYVVDSVSDIVTETAGAGVDLIQSSVTYTISANVENLTLTGTAAINATGNTLANMVTGNAGNNAIDGGAGNDTLVGGAGNDTLYGNVGNDSMSGGTGDDIYRVDSAADVVTELLDEGIDTVQATLSYTLGANTENLLLSGTGSINGTGNDANNNITGNTAANVINGGAGNDTLIGGAGNDTYVIGLGMGSDTIQENDAVAGNADVVSFLAGVTTDQLWFQRTGNNLEVSVIGTSDRATIQDWYMGSAFHVEQFKTADGKTLLDAQVDNLVSAMAAFSPPAAGQTTLPSNYQSALTGVIAANWS
ncbi:MAG: hypothetical protein RLY71_920, partial [Pseudomonadota bacterium]